MTYEYKELGSLLTKMGEIVEAEITDYKSDFYKYDVDVIQRKDEEKFFSFAWLVRDTGTWLTESAKFMAMFLYQTPHKVYVVEKKDGIYSITYYGTYSRA